MITFECGSDYWKVPIGIFIVDLKLHNDLEISIDHCHRSG
jgi:hypothetical protein